jgi:hypothetical protein
VAGPPWPRDVPPPRQAPRGERDRRPAETLPEVPRERVLLDALHAAAEESRVVRGLLVGLVARVVAFWRTREAHETDLRRALSGERWHAARLRGALDAAADRAVVAEARLERVRAALPALRGAGRRSEIVALVDDLEAAIGDRP